MAQQYGARLAKLFACACLLGGVGVDATYVQLAPSLRILAALRNVNEQRCQ
jgi:hypothetical protein